MSDKFTTPKHLRTLRAKMVLNGFSLREVSKKARVPYSVASMLLSGKLVRPKSLARITNVIATMPEEVCA